MVRNFDHRVVGMICFDNVKELTSQKLEEFELFSVFKELVSLNFESVIFSEIHFKMEAITFIEKLIKPKEEE
jgi:hypothetical protein